MNYSDSSYTNMLFSFRTSDLQTLLGMFGQSRNGRKNELRDHAVELLRNRQQSNFNHQAYRSKIAEIYAPIHAPNSDRIHNQQRQMISVQPRQQRMFLAAQYPQQPMRLTQQGLQIVQRSRGMYRSAVVANNNHVQQFSYQLTVSRQVATNPRQLNIMASGTMAIASGRNNIYIQQQSLPPLPSLSNIVFRKLPFYELLDGLVAPLYLNPQDRFQSNPKDLKEATFKFRLTAEQATLITMHRELNNNRDMSNNHDMSNNRFYYVNDVQIRICNWQSGPVELVDCLPIGLAIKVNGRIIQLPPSNNKPGTKPGVEARRIPRPLNIAHYMKLSPICDNVITVYWNPDGKMYVMSLNLIKKLSSNTLINKLIEKGGRRSEETKKYIIKKLANDDPDLATTSYRVSLICPLGKMRMKLPVKSIKCSHELQCFDGSVFILMNEKKPTWTCPTCSKICLYEDIQIQTYFLDVIASPTLTDSCKEIEILANGTWRMYEENKKPKNGDTSLDNKGKPIDSVNLDSDDEMEVVTLAHNPQPGCSKETHNVPLRPSLVDLTLSDDDDKEPPKTKQGNEARAAKITKSAKIPTAVNKKPQVQPKQAVTSSEQGDVIEISSPTPPSSPA